MDLVTDYNELTALSPDGLRTSPYDCEEEEMMTTTSTITTVNRFRNVVLAARVGDAMGTPTESLTPHEIDDRYGWVSDFDGDGTDDSLMATILAESLIVTEGRAGADDWAGAILENRETILQKRDKFFPSVLHLVEKLESGYRPSEVAIGNMPSTSSAMCIWPVALISPGDPDTAATHAYALASLIHTGDVDYCTDAAAALAAAISAAFLPEADVHSCLRAAARVIRPASGTWFARTLEDAVLLATRSEGYEGFRDEYQRTFARPIFCDSLETVPAAFALAMLAGGEVRTAVEFAANFGRDSDTIASMVGALCGALSLTLPDTWLTKLGPGAVQAATDLAEQLELTARMQNAAERDRLDATAEILAVAHT